MLNNPDDLESVDQITQKYMNTDPEVTKKHWAVWPQHNEEAQMENMREASDYLIGLHKDKNNLMTFPLSEVVFKTTGKVILHEASNPTHPVHWLSHDVVAKTHLEYFE
jgi:hypothetical protein